MTAEDILLPAPPDAPQFFGVSDDFYWNRRGPKPLELCVTYAGHTDGSFQIEYDGWENPFQSLGTIAIDGDGAQHTASFLLDNARLGNSQDGADFRIVTAPGTRVEIRAISLTSV